MKLLYKFPSRSRPKKFLQCIDNIYINQRHDDYTILASLDIDDATMNNEDMIEKMKHYDKLYPTWGKSINKIHAYNRDIDKASEFDILISMSDDMLFVKNGFDIEIIADMMTYYPEMDGVLHYNDGNQKGNVMTLSIMGRKYYDRFDYIYHPEYESLFCDQEATDVARLLNKYKYLGDEKILFRHLHPAWGLGEYDKQYELTERRDIWNQDEATYNKRKANNFGI